MPDETPRDERAKRPTPVRKALEDAGGARVESGDKRGRAQGKRPRRAGDHPPTDGRAPSSPGLRGQKERPAGPKPAGGARKDRKPKRPVSARISVEGAASRPTPPEGLPSRTFSVDGVEWIVRLSGKAFAGVTPRSGAPLLEVAFYHPDAPTSVVSRALTVGRSFADVAEESFPGLLDGARPVSDTPDRA